MQSRTLIVVRSPIMPNGTIRFGRLDTKHRNIALQGTLNTKTERQRERTTPQRESSHTTERKEESTIDEVYCALGGPPDTHEVKGF